MKFVLLATMLSGLLVPMTAARAQTAMPTVTGAAALPAAFTLDTPIEEIAADPTGRAVLDKDLPHLRFHPSYEQSRP